MKAVRIAAWAQFAFVTYLALVGMAESDADIIFGAILFAVLPIMALVNIKK